ncbi:uncharacterized protein I303_105391 [Kwoniella dejecticola CBS 10117]|uniref:Uncharacterized protein n=1 Tax=Kwoniella dejecticola CBS 10117 TaxID=1296121 RepID=A0A1A6A2L9_9TREE|nr:uncharacterized protein I303_05164 [Kwoniella dejecticola CBS 10117]OBR84306.1 hypothetical protein I303_05164 [Kwoniella dejecticola CBS 10117]
MSINSVHLGSNHTLPLKASEEVLTAGHTADVELKVPATIQGPKRTETAKGRIWVTDQRVIFVADSIDLPGPSSRTSNTPNPPGYDAPPVLSSIEIPYSALRSATYNLPTFSANHLLLNFVPSPNNGNNGNSALPDPGIGQFIELKIWVGEGAGHALWKRIEGERNRQEERARTRDEEVLRQSIVDSSPLHAPPSTFQAPAWSL